MNTDKEKIEKRRATEEHGVSHQDGQERATARHLTHDTRHIEIHAAGYWAPDTTG